MTAMVGPYSLITTEKDCRESKAAGHPKDVVEEINKHCEVISHGHYEITMLAPKGMGSNHMIQVSVGGRLTNTNLMYSFTAELREVSPGSVFRGNGYLDALGMEDDLPLELRGDNFGGVESNTSIFIDGETCPDAKWNPTVMMGSVRVLQAQRDDSRS